VDFIGDLLQPDVRALLYQLYEELPFVKVLGSYRVDTTEEPA
jgi:chorismate mutase/prephenate dehydratase